MTPANKKIIAIDDNITNLTAIRNILKSQYEVYTATSAGKMFELLAKIKPEMILLDVEMPELNGYEAARILKNTLEHSIIPIIFVSSKNDPVSEMEGLELGAVDYIYKPYAAPLLLKRIEMHLSHAEMKNELRQLNASIQRKLVSKMSQVLELKNAVISIVADMVEFRDGATGGHVSRTERYLQNLINKMTEEELYAEEVSTWDMDFLITSALLHDVGKIAISDTILLKPGKLTDDEYEIMKTHSQIGVDAISRMEKKTEDNRFFAYAKIFAGTHHEKWDGSGYPRGLQGKDIPLEGRLMAIADVYDALVSPRPYKEPFSPEKAERIIEEGRGTFFDPQLVDIFKLVSREFAEISRLQAD
ncbi:MAG: response regulator [Oscillospiraceae bacterium]|nr:response regulator [Oscillospiraceae bacterium]